MEFLGYERPDGSVGVRNYVMVLPANRCSNELAARIAEEVGPGAVTITHNYACVFMGPDREAAVRCLTGIGCNPNVAATLVVGIGCEGTKAETIADRIAASKKPLEVLTIENVGDYETTLDKGVQVVRKMLSDASLLKRQAFNLGRLTLAVKCGGSGAISAVACNPVVGSAVDAIIKDGGTAIFSETAEIIGAENVLARRAADEKVAKRIYEMADRMQSRLKSAGVDVLGSDPTPGNIKEGLTTLEEKSLGAISKGGTTPLKGVLEWAEKPEGKGLFFMDGSANSPQMFLGLAATGAQLITFGFGGGLPARFRSLPASASGGIPVLPVIKILSNPGDSKEKDYFDVFLGDVVEGRESVPD
ncbi:UxaA family hydrolase, partial [Chloroflexota bacterium]